MDRDSRGTLRGKNERSWSL